MRYGLVLLISSLFIFSCTKNESDVSTSNPCSQAAVRLHGERPNLNLTIFLDLSDRISPIFNPKPSLSQWERDLGYIETIVSSFENHLRNKRTITINDEIRLFFHPIPTDVPEIDAIVSSLNKSFDRSNATLENICSLRGIYDDNLRSIYRKTLDLNEPYANSGIDKYPGSNIFDFFKSRVKDYSVDPTKVNKLIIITDGYLYMEGTNYIDGNSSNYLLSSLLSRWGFNAINFREKISGNSFALVEATQGLDKIEVLVLGITPKQNWELEVINSLWNKWFIDMGVANFQNNEGLAYLKQDDLPSEIRPVIERFIYNQ